MNCERLPPLGGRAVLQAVDRGDVGVVEGGQQLRFASEPRHEVRIVRGAGGQGLDRHITTQPFVAAAIDVAHPALAQSADDLVRSDACASSQSHRAVRKNVLRWRSGLPQLTP